MIAEWEVSFVSNVKNMITMVLAIFIFTFYKERQNLQTYN